MQYSSDAGSPRRPASNRDADPLQRSTLLPAPHSSDPVRNALLIASVFASVLVGGVALKTLFSNNNSHDLSAIQAPR